MFSLIVKNVSILDSILYIFNVYRSIGYHSKFCETCGNVSIQYQGAGKEPTIVCVTSVKVDDVLPLLNGSCPVAIRKCFLQQPSPA